ncbi:hypothetical protein P5673_018570 [Acropora cervicornis]|uniref:Reverse transcriptase domain-containing protein n=1 Tax=Acropora cervicornis TaxID=6130 RepID=A0AAD9QD00_ACRCE|nr:hypothetical protein P5673_018570 [Acropora cervicornis]
MRNAASPDADQLITMNTDALALLGHTMCELSMHRRDAIRPNLNKDYSSLCDSHVPVTTYLFGDNLETQLNDIGASNKISKAAVPQTFDKARPYGHPHFHSTNNSSSQGKKFTKLLKPVYSSLRKKGHISSPYIDDSILMCDNFNECALNVVDTVKVLDNLNFVTHPEKSMLLPRRVIVFPGFILNSITMTVSLTPEKADKLKLAVTRLLSSGMPLIREVAQVIRLIISTFPGVMYGPLYFRVTEGEKAQALKQTKGNYDT